MSNSSLAPAPTRPFPRLGYHKAMNKARRTRGRERILRLPHAVAQQVVQVRLPRVRGHHIPAGSIRQNCRAVASSDGAQALPRQSSQSGGGGSGSGARGMREARASGMGRDVMIGDCLCKPAGAPYMLPRVGQLRWRGRCGCRCGRWGRARPQILPRNGRGERHCAEQPRRASSGDGALPRCCALLINRRHFPNAVRGDRGAPATP